ncbi:enoyl-[acyl-carrier-protein] reductase FabK [Aerococcus sp. Group 1]|uniref:enoyl-[acyl-carrier-protein] reductase FabK n=1 Tax=Aerococcus urinae (strain CCUG 59500 / ACS-120-V-Col10a) TaxID=2976812 RepID=UPI000200E4FD|nr:enoyl-[acyl-carrier-protein] reductase FabK [Aerococcus sp. Group 1]AEA01417.1 putative enoyl-[acyl-carrier-protein] reductase II [Aerococcus sp. Group 1]MCY3031585.1 enoyl-[acyl-carrier-protein] reductase FabK [Aerococcus sp. Group 1]MCY3055202.1 enoyl-[acyl-carrier-protein] reductase FabK [Aerococcus sp. Group 1]MCY3056932.1 enoyl-[acyl-carrier-protein] reductase FabK [Aerococcus sp. Group 1]MCY3062428.1 enoyl-[acyl-carrier-protein] reductase FabK [Aerococcus sp. Group 1]
MNTLWKQMGVKYPIIQGAMAWVADPDLASAVSNAGGLGVVGTGNDPVEVVREKVETMKAKTDKPFAINVMLLNPHVEEVVDYLCQSGISTVTTGAGSPGRFMKQFREANIKVIPVVASVALARRMEKEGVDAVVVEGTESGGHVGKTTTMALLPQVVDAVNIPVIAAGGIGDGRGMAAALMLGACGIQVGTRFVCAKESNAHPNFKEKIIKAKDIDTVTTGEATGHPVRVLRNRLTKEYLRVERIEAGKENPDWERLEALGRGALRRAVVEGDTQNSSLMAGQIAGLINKEESCQKILQSYMDVCQTTIREKASEWL